MKRYLKKVVTLLVLTLIVGCFAGFPIKVSASALNSTKLTYTCADKGKTKTLKVTGSKNGKYKHNGKWYTIKWSSSNKKVASVNKNGKVKVVAKKTGSATIKATFKIKDGNVGFTKEIGTCKVTVGHANETTTEYREPTLYAPGGNYELSTCKVCGSKSEKLVGKAVDFQYTEDFVKEQMENIYYIANNECPGNFKSSKKFLKFLVSNGYYPESILSVDCTATGGAGVTGMCEDGCAVYEKCLSGYQNYQLISTWRDTDFNYFEDLRPGDILSSDTHVMIVKDYYICSNGDVLVQGYTGANGKIIFDEFKIESENGIGTRDFQHTVIYRLPNYI